MSDVTTSAPAEKASKKKTAAPVAAPVAADFPIRTDVVMPERAKSTRGGNGGKYPFAALPEPVDGKCASFPLFDRNAKQIQSTVYCAMKRFADLTTDGKIATRNRVFKAVDVDPGTDPDGAICRVFRTK